ncbi:MAG: GNAT family N-acetyltransferase [Chlorobi bacterium]|nr:GNAT family N-acetyltransferase [Chlorobiota bacterium]NOG66610.1 GNAT family N-acetyltransferase [Chlorobiota bacterium]
MNLSITALEPGNTLPFIKCQWSFYKNDPNWVAPLVSERKKLLSITKNPVYAHTQIQLFVAERNGTIVGRIAAIRNGNHLATHNDDVGFFGFFECINDQDVANALFKAEEQWLKDRGLQHVRGPVNPTQNDECGLLVEGAEGPPVILMTYNPPYYADLIQRAGYSKIKDLHAYWVSTQTYRSDKLSGLMKSLIERRHITFRNVNFKDKAQFKKDVEQIKSMYNTAWQPNWGFVKMTDAEFDFLASDLKQIADPDFIFFVEIKGEPVGFILALPDVNQALIYNRGGSLLGAGFHLLTKKTKINRLRIIVLGVLPEHQRSGADAALYYEVGERAKRKGMVGAEASWILEDNTMMVRGLTQTMNAELYRTYRLYQKSLTQEH